MSDEPTVKRESSKIEKNERETLEKAFKFLRNAGLAGTLTLGGMIVGAVNWLDARISTTVSEAVRKEVDPLKERIIRLEVRGESKEK